MKKNDVVQFNENHKWCGALGIINEVKDCKENGQEELANTYIKSCNLAIRIEESKNNLKNKINSIRI